MKGARAAGFLSKTAESESQDIKEKGAAAKQKFCYGTFFSCDEKECLMFIQGTLRLNFAIEIVNGDLKLSFQNILP